ncbi:hypothetical protein [Halovulum sp. GXIMD14793]
MIRRDLSDWFSTLRFNLLEVISFLIVAGLGLGLAWSAMRQGGWLTAAIGLVIAAVALAFLFVILMVARTRSDSSAPGIVEISERRIAYLAPKDGAVIDLDEVTRIDIRTTDSGPFAPDVFWVFTVDGQGLVTIPTNARDAGDIIGVIDGLPGASMQNVIAAMTCTENATFPIWQAEPRQA